MTINIDLADGMSDRKTYQLDATLFTCALFFNTVQLAREEVEGQLIERAGQPAGAI